MVAINYWYVWEVACKKTCQIKFWAYVNCPSGDNEEGTENQSMLAICNGHVWEGVCRRGRQSKLLNSEEQQASEFRLLRRESQAFALLNPTEQFKTLWMNSRRWMANATPLSKLEKMKKKGATKGGWQMVMDIYMYRRSCLQEATHFQNSR